MNKEQLYYLINHFKGSLKENTRDDDNTLSIADLNEEEVEFIIKLLEEARE